VNTSVPGWSERGTLARDGDRLIHTCVSAPADAEETFTGIYHRDQ
jgi:hypothetical protein